MNDEETAAVEASSQNSADDSTKYRYDKWRTKSLRKDHQKRGVHDGDFREHLLFSFLRGLRRILVCLPVRRRISRVGGALCVPLRAPSFESVSGERDRRPDTTGSSIEAKHIGVLSR